jgi:hypothetical protein
VNLKDFQMSNKTLVIGWFSFELMGTTAGDAIARDIACAWLRKVGVDPDVAMWEPRETNEIQTTQINPASYDTVVFVCGPIGDGPPLNTFLDRFPHARKFALNVSLLQERSEWNPFLAILERDSSERVTPDLTFAAQDRRVPVAGLILVGPQEEYPTERHDLAQSMMEDILKARDVAVVPIDTRLDINKNGLRSPAQIESLIAKMDLVFTTRLHGAVIALRRHVPPVVIDSIPGGTKLYKQMKRIGWPLAFHTGDLNRAQVEAAFDYALTEAARQEAIKCAAAAREELQQLERDFLQAFQGGLSQAKSGT